MNFLYSTRAHTHTHSSSLLDKSAWIFDPRVCHITMYALCYIPPYIYPRKLSIDRFARIFSYPRKMHSIKINAPISRLHIFSFLIFFARARAHTHARTHIHIYIYPETGTRGASARCHASDWTKLHTRTYICTSLTNYSL